MSKKWIKPVAAGVIFLASLLPDLGWAYCYVETGAIQKIKVNLGPIAVSSDMPVGKVLDRQELPVSASYKLGRCHEAGGHLIADMLIGQPSDYDPKIYTTNVQGIGIRISWKLSGRNTKVFPYNDRLANHYTFLWGWNKYHFRQQPGTVKVEIIKIAKQVGSGTLMPGLYAHYYAGGSGPGKPMTTITLGATVITASACEVDMGSRHIAVDFGTVSRSMFAGVGSTNTEKEFQVGLACVGPGHGQDSVKLSFAYTPDPSGAPGVIKIDGGTEAASGVGIQLLDNRTASPIDKGERIELGAMTPGKHRFQLPLKARYYQTAPTVNGGETRAIATFTIEYN